MPRYFFNIGDDRDSEGTELESLAVAKCQAVRLAGQTICDGSEEFWDSAELFMAVTDANGLLLFHLEIIGTDAPVIRPNRPPLLAEPNS